MRLIQVFVFYCFISICATCAAAPAPVQPAVSGAAHAEPQVQRKLVRSENEIRRLKQNVQRQESHSEQAGKRLQQQDQTIAELQKQLQALQSSQASGQH